MRDRPEGPALLALAREILLDDLLPLLPEESRADARLIARAMAIAERERAAGETPFAAVTRELQDFYQRPLTPALSPHCGERENALWRRFARDLRTGAFEADAPRERDARALLWRLTVARLREANPRLLALSGLA